MCTDSADRAECETMMGLIAKKLNKRSDAITHLQTACKIDPLHSNRHWTLVETLFEYGRTEKAIAAAKRARQICQDNQRFIDFLEKHEQDAARDNLFGED